jgi:hypothetical protein
MSFLADLQYLIGPSREPYWKYMARLIEDYRKLFRQNIELRDRLTKLAHPELVPNQEFPQLREAFPHDQTS